MTKGPRTKGPWEFLFDNLMDLVRVENILQIDSENPQYFCKTTLFQNPGDASDFNAILTKYMYSTLFNN
jgi:hypothetical protein